MEPTRTNSPVLTHSTHCKICSTRLQAGKKEIAHSEAPSSQIITERLRRAACQCTCGGSSADVVGDDARGGNHWKSGRPGRPGTPRERCATSFRVLDRFRGSRSGTQDANMRGAGTKGGKSFGKKLGEIKSSVSSGARDAVVTAYDGAHTGAPKSRGTS